MSETEEIKKNRGRPKKKITNDEVKTTKKNGRPKKYEEGYYDHKYTKILVDRKHYYDLIEIEKKYSLIKI